MGGCAQHRPQLLACWEHAGCPDLFQRQPQHLALAPGMLWRWRGLVLQPGAFPRQGSLLRGTGTRRGRLGAAGLGGLDAERGAGGKAQGLQAAGQVSRAEAAPRKGLEQGEGRQLGVQGLQAPLDPPQGAIGCEALA